MSAAPNAEASAAEKKQAKSRTEAKERHMLVNNIKLQDICWRVGRGRCRHGLRPRDGGPQGDRDHADAKLQVCGGARNRTTSHIYAAARAGA